MSKKKTALISILCLGALASSVGFTFAKYTVATKLDQPINSKGKSKSSIFLDPFIWDSDNPLYMMYCIGAEETSFIYPSKTVNVKIDNITYPLRVFEFDDVKYDKFIFMRINSKIAALNFSDDADGTYYIDNVSTGVHTELYQNKSDENYYIANHVSFEAGQSFNITDGTTTYSNANDGSSTEYDIDSSGNIRFVTAGTYTIEFYVKADNNMHVVLTNETSPLNFKWNQTEDITFREKANYYKIVGWNNSTYGNSTYQEKRYYIDSDGQPQIGNVP